LFEQAEGYFLRNGTFFLEPVEPIEVDFIPEFLPMGFDES